MLGFIANISFWLYALGEDKITAEIDFQGVTQDLQACLEKLCLVNVTITIANG